MKKLIALLLALVMALSITVVGVTAEEEIDYANPTITIDGVLDEDYYPGRVINDDWWYCFEGKGAYDPVDYEFLKNTLYFTWDNDFLYFHFTCEVYPDAPIYKPEEGETFTANVTPAEQISVYIDAAPSLAYGATCQNKTNTNPCTHFYCNCNDGDGKYYRLQARGVPSFNNKWYNYYRTDEGMFLTYEKFCDLRCNPDSAGYGEAYVADPEGMYMKENGACEAATFIDYENNTYGCELKYPRGKDEEKFLCNFTVNTQGYEWEELGPELPYQESACLNPWMVPSGEGMFQIYYDEYPIVDDVEDPAVKEVVDAIAALPVSKDVKLEHKANVDAIQAKYDALNDDQKAAIAEDVLAKFNSVKERLVKLELAENMGDVNGDNKTDAGDALDVLKHVVGKGAIAGDALILADVNADTKVDAGDALDILKFVVGKLPSFKAAAELLK